MWPRRTGFSLSHRPIAPLVSSIANDVSNQPPAVARSAAGPRRVLLSLMLVAAAVAAIYWLMREQRLRWIIEQGQATIVVDAGAADLSTTVERWVGATQKAWPTSDDSLIAALLDVGPAKSRQARAMLERVADASYGEREDDWRRWESNRERARKGQQDFGTRGERVALRPRWEAAIGLTSWFSSIIALDGEIYVPSLGGVFGQDNDAADGIVKISGREGRTELILPPPVGGRVDVIGVSAGDERVFGACLNGFVFAVDRQSGLQWFGRAGEELCGGPMSCDLNRDGVLDVLVVNGENRIVALAGGDGNVMWRSPRLDSGDASRGAVLSAGAGEIWITLPGGFVGQVSPANGALRWSARVPNGCLSGVTVAWPGTTTAGYLADRDGRVWAILLSRGATPALVQLSSADPRGRSSMAAVRTLRMAGGAADLVLSTLTGRYDAGDGAVFGLQATGIAWQIPLEAAMWGSPAIADLNRDDGGEVATLGILPPAREGEAARGRLRVLSMKGHLVRQLDLPAASECSPLVIDLDGDHRSELLIADQSGMLRCYETFSGGAIEWGSLGGDPHNTRNAEAAYSYGQTVFGRQWSWRGTGRR